MGPGLSSMIERSDLHADYFPTLVRTRSGPKSLETSSRFILSPAHRDPLVVLPMKIFFSITNFAEEEKKFCKKNLWIDRKIRIII